ncbi:MAG: glycosyl hydrolase [Ruminococcaceae bacterium]|nr:glycosyl hydrolase [Oscillospiraceae bacterium]
MNIKERIAKLSLEEKAALLQGRTTWTTYAIEHADIPEIFLADGPHGLRKQVGSADHLGLNESIPSTCFPTAAAMANSWNTALAERLGEALGKEAAANRVGVLLGPGLNVKRSPLAGRNFEYFSEDPYLSGKMAAAYIRGIQKNGIAACPKHFAVNSQELRRMANDSVLDERTLREIYLTGFEIAVKEGGARSIMSSYNMVNGRYANENTHLISDILRGEWGFGGFVVTDWGADNDHTEGVMAGSNLVMPNPGMDSVLALIEDVRSGRLDEQVLNDRLYELLSVTVPVAEAVENEPREFSAEEHHALARKCAEESIVLLENDGILPLGADKKIAVIGDFAKQPRYQGAGSSQVNPIKLECLYDCLTERGLDITAYAKGFDKNSTKPDRALIDEAISVAGAADVVLLCVGLDDALESEGTDREDMELSESQKELISAVTSLNKNVILVLSGGSPFVMPSAEGYRAAIHGYLGGEAGASAMAAALVGDINPSGKLNESWPERLEDTPCYRYFPGKERTSEYREGLFVGYRFYDTVDAAVRYPFGYGMSYTSFEYSDIEVSDEGVSFTLTNTGSMAGAEIAELYIGKESDRLSRPKKELKGFAKVYLEPGESTRASIPFDDKSFRYFDTNTGMWQTESGEYLIHIASDSRHTRLSATVKKDGVTPEYSYPTCYMTADIKLVSDSDFEALLGHPIPNGKWGGEITANDTFCQLYYAKSLSGRLIYKILTSLVNKAKKKGDPNLNIVFVYNMPLRALTKFSGGTVSRKMTEDILLILNGHFFRGVGALIADSVRNRRRSAGLKKLLGIGKKHG